MLTQAHETCTSYQTVHTVLKLSGPRL